MDLFIVIFIYLIVPFLGLMAYILLVRKMLNEHFPNPPYLSYFFCFFLYGGILQILLTGLFWRWSGLASLGAGFLVFLGPIIMGLIISNTRKKRKLTIYHNYAFKLARNYIIVITIVIVCSVIINIFKI